MHHAVPYPTTLGSKTSRIGNTAKNHQIWLCALPFTIVLPFSFDIVNDPPSIRDYQELGGQDGGGGTLFMNGIFFLNNNAGFKILLNRRAYFEDKKDLFACTPFLVEIQRSGPKLHK